MTVTGGFAGEVNDIREYFDTEEFKDCIGVSYKPVGGFEVDTDLFCASKTFVGDPDSDDHSVRALFYEIIVGRDHVLEPGGGDTFIVTNPNGSSFSVGDSFSITGVIESDGETARLYGEKV